MRTDLGRAQPTLLAVSLAMAACAMVSAAQTGTPGPRVTPIQPEQETVVLRAFQQRIDAYVALHRQLEGPLPPLQVSRDMNTVRRATDALAKGIRAARAAAGQGDIFTPQAANLLRTYISTCLTAEDVQAIVGHHEKGEDQGERSLAVNRTWPEDVDFNFVPPHLIESLPTLPPELQYRIVGRSLVLWDHHANLIVDVLPSALTM
jgi:hypothetical protein